MATQLQPRPSTAFDRVTPAAPPAARTARGMLDTTSLMFGRAVFGGYCLYNGINHFLHRDIMASYARSKNVPMPMVAVLGSGAMLAIGGISLITGAKPKIGSSLVTAFLAGVSPVMHNFWDIEDEQQRMSELVNFSKNMALIGGACFAAAVPEPWPASVPDRGARR